MPGTQFPGRVQEQHLHRRTRSGPADKYPSRRNSRVYRRSGLAERQAGEFCPRMYREGDQVSWAAGRCHSGQGRFSSAWPMTGRVRSIAQLTSGGSCEAALLGNGLPPPRVFLESGCQKKAETGFRSVPNDVEELNSYHVSQILSQSNVWRRLGLCCRLQGYLRKPPRSCPAARKSRSCASGCHGERSEFRQPRIFLSRARGHPDQFIQWPTGFFRACTRKNSKCSPIFEQTT